MTRLLAVPLDASDVFLMTFMILQDSYMEPTRVGSDIGPCTFPQFNFSPFYLYMEDLLGSNVNVARDRIQFVA